MCVCTRARVYLGSSEASLPEGWQEKERISSPKVWGSAKQTENEVPPYARQDLEEGEKTCDSDWLSATAVSPMCRERPGSASVSKKRYQFNRSGTGPRNLNFNKCPTVFCWG